MKKKIMYGVGAVIVLVMLGSFMGIIPVEAIFDFPGNATGLN
ncbi:MAG: hypothetical protein WC284_08795 [Candidimonas sp.]